MGLFSFLDSGWTFAILVFLFLAFLIGDNDSLESHSGLSDEIRLRFVDSSNSPVQGYVFLNDECLGKSVNGSLYTDSLSIGELDIIFEKNGTFYINSYDINLDDLDYYMIVFEVNDSEMYRIDQDLLQYFINESNTSLDI